MDMLACTRAAPVQQSAGLGLQPHKPRSWHARRGSAPALALCLSVHAERRRLRYRVGLGSGWRPLLPRRTDSRDALKMFRYYLLVPLAKLTRRSWMHPRFNTKYNALQRVAHFSVPVAGLLSVLTGWAILALS
jgi:hypothetical protein